MSQTPTEETYLGDGLYASFDGWHLHLRAPREGGDHYVGLEPEVFREFIKYAQSIAEDFPPLAALL